MNNVGTQLCDVIRSACEVANDVLNEQYNGALERCMKQLSRSIGVEEAIWIVARFGIFEFSEGFYHEACDGFAVCVRPEEDSDDPPSRPSTITEWAVDYMAVSGRVAEGGKRDTVFGDGGLNENCLTEVSML